MSPATTTPVIRGRLAWAVVAILAAYTVAHFAVSGVRQPLQQGPALNQLEEELDPLRTFLATGSAPQTANQRQYGPVFFFLIQPLLWIAGDDATAFSQWQYAFQLVVIPIAFVCCFVVLRLWLRRTYGDAIEQRLPASHLAILLGLLWFNFSPLYYILAGRSVETWELALIAAALLFYLRDWRFAAAFCIAAATLIKMLPVVFLLYFLIRDRRTFAYALVSFVILLTVAHVLYWPQMGFGYFPYMATASVGQTHALGWHENLSLKNMVVKVMTGWRLAAPSYYAPIEGTRLMVASLIGHLLQVAGVLWMAWALWSFRSESPRRPAFDAIWAWSLISVCMLILSPVTAHEYMVLALIAFSFVFVYLLAGRDHLHGSRRVAWICVAGATLLVGNILPRQVINAVLPIAALNRLTDNARLTLSEGYQHYGFPLLGLFLLLAVLWMMRPLPAADLRVSSST